MTLRKLLFKLLSEKAMNIDELFKEINLKNEIARPTIRGRISDMIRDGEVKRLGDLRNQYSETKFEAIPISVQKQIRKQKLEEQKQALRQAKNIPEKQEIPLTTH